MPEMCVGGLQFQSLHAQPILLYFPQRENVTALFGGSAVSVYQCGSAVKYILKDMLRRRARQTFFESCPFIFYVLQYLLLQYFQGTHSFSNTMQCAATGMFSDPWGGIFDSLSVQTIADWPAVYL